MNVLRSTTIKLRGEVCQCQGKCQDSKSGFSRQASDIKGSRGRGRNKGDWPTRYAMRRRSSLPHLQTNKKKGKRTFNMRLARELAHRIDTWILLQRLLPLGFILHALVEAHEREGAEGEATHYAALQNKTANSRRVWRANNYDVRPMYPRAEMCRRERRRRTFFSSHS